MSEEKQKNKKQKDKKLEDKMEGLIGFYSPDETKPKSNKSKDTE